MSRTIHSLIAFSFVCIATAQPDYTPPDPYNDALKVSYGIWEQLGQVHGPGAGDIQYYTDGAELQAYFQKDGKFSLVLARVDTIMATPDTLNRLDISFTGKAAQTPDALAYQMKDYIQNFYLPWCGPNGVTNVHGYNRVVYENIYPYIDMHVYSGRAGQKIAFVIRPGGILQNLQLLLEGQNQISLDLLGNLKILMQNKLIVLPKAVAYQVDQFNNIQWLNWTASYVPNNNTGVVSFTNNAYDNTKPLVLLIGMAPMDGPPVTAGVCYSTYFGATGTDGITANTIDTDGNHYVTGWTNATFVNFPGNVGASYILATTSIYACRINDLDHIEWKDFFGGSDAFQSPRGIALREGADPKVYVGGWTACTNFFCLDANPGNDYFDATGLGNNGFLVRLNQDDGLLEHSTYFGNGTDITEVTDVTIDPLGRLIAVGTTTGNLPVHQVPLPAGAEQWNYGGNEDGYIALFNLNDQVLWSTPFGGSDLDAAVTVRANSSKIVVVGRSSSGTFPQALNGGGNWNESTPAGYSDIAILEFNMNGDEQWGTLFGGNSIESPGAHGLDIDPLTGDIYIVGSTRSTDLPLLYTTDWHDDTPPGNYYNGFIMEFSNSRDRLWVSYASSSGNGNLNAVRISQDRQIFLGGYAAAAFPCQPRLGLYSTNALLGGQDGVIMHFDVAHQYLWGTYFGGEGAEEIHTLALKENERLYACGTTTTQYLPALLFPLTDEDIMGSWFYDFRQGSLDGFISAFCFADVVGISASDLVDRSVMLAWPDASGQWSVVGASPGIQPLFVCDAAGRATLRTLVRVPTDAPFHIDPGVLAAGTYMLRIGDRTAKVLVLKP